MAVKSQNLRNSELILPKLEKPCGAFKTVSTLSKPEHSEAVAALDSPEPWTLRGRHVPRHQLDISVESELRSNIHWSVDCEAIVGMMELYQAGKATVQHLGADYRLLLSQNIQSTIVSLNVERFR